MRDGTTLHVLTPVERPGPEGNFVRGLLFGLALALPFWAIVAAVAWMLS